MDKQKKTVKIDWKAKLSSRKLWAAVLAAMMAGVAALLGEDLTPEVVTVVQAAVTALIAYIFGEGAVDAVRMIAEAVKAAMEKKGETEEADEGEGETSSETAEE